MYLIVVTDPRLQFERLSRKFPVKYFNLGFNFQTTAAVTNVNCFHQMNILQSTSFEDFSFVAWKAKKKKTKNGKIPS